MTAIKDRLDALDRIDSLQRRIHAMGDLLSAVSEANELHEGTLPAFGSMQMEVADELDECVRFLMKLGAREQAGTR